MASRQWRLTMTIIVLAVVQTGHTRDGHGQDAPVQEEQSVGKVIIQSVPPGVPVNPELPPLQLSDAQRMRIAQVLIRTHSEVSLELKENESAKSFEPHVDETVPKGLEGEAFPSPLISEIPLTKQYIYLRFKGQVLIVNPMTRKIVDMFPERLAAN